ncbi:MAG: hypothetical protein FWH21_03480 [Kiritimatiellaeota bacterium]|nr:hypothetical protein [Kiritimatiellota bacterium]
MTLSEQQRQAVREWVAGGGSLSDVQRNLKTEFGITLTYMDVRLLVLEIGAELKDAPSPPTPQPQPSDEEEMGDDEFPAHEDAAPPMEGERPREPGGDVRLTLDAIVVPGAMVSGHAVFSDGTKARWVIDQYGRFGLDPETKGYRPSPEDMQTFQALLRAELQRKGYM